MDKLRTWLHTLYLSIILPPDRDPSTPLREERASSVGLFMMTLVACIKALGIPAHNIFLILDELLAKTYQTMKAILSNDSPAVRSGKNSLTKNKYDLSAFYSELVNQSAIFMQNNMLCSNVLSTKALPTASASLYELKIRGMETTYSDRWEYTVGIRCKSAALGFLLQKCRDTRYNISTGASSGDMDPMAMMMAQMRPDMGMAGMMKKSKLRKALLDQGSAIGHVFSCVKWDIKTQKVSFWMCDDLFNKFKDYSFVLIRTDG